MPLDEDVVAAIYRDHGTALKRFVLSCTPDAHLADDVVQETILKVWQHAPHITGSLRSYLFRTARNVIIDNYRKARRRPATSFSVNAISSTGARYILQPPAVAGRPATPPNLAMLPRRGYLLFDVNVKRSNFCPRLTAVCPRLTFGNEGIEKDARETGNPPLHRMRPALRGDRLLVLSRRHRERSGLLVGPRHPVLAEVLAGAFPPPRGGGHVNRGAGARSFST